MLSHYYQEQKKFCLLKELRYIQLNTVYESRIDHRIVYLLK